MENNDIRQPNANDQEQIQTISLSSYLSQAKDFYHAKKYKKCLLYVSLYLKLHPFSFDALFLKGKTYIQLYQYNKSLVSISKANRVSKAMKNEEKEQRIDILFLKAQCFRGLNDNNQAIAIYDKINAITPTARAYLCKGACLYNLNMKDLAIINYNQAITLNPNYTEAYFNKGICLSNINKKEEAISVYNKVVELNANHIEAYLQRSYCYYSIGKVREAYSDANKVIELNHNYPEAFYRKGMCLVKMSRFDEAVLEYDKVIELIKNSSVNLSNKNSSDVNLLYETYFSKGYCLRKSKKYQEALKEYLNCINLIKTNELAYFQIGILHMKMNHPDKAIDFFDKTI